MRVTENNQVLVCNRYNRSVFQRYCLSSPIHGLDSNSRLHSLSRAINDGNRVTLFKELQRSERVSPDVLEHQGIGGCLNAIGFSDNTSTIHVADSVQLIRRIALGVLHPQVEVIYERSHAFFEQFYCKSINRQCVIPPIEIH